mmetsp:Transcript_2448/g.5324  ORF Transcript_2448/g.5324 Transcript_2448/m.5324 type:complete len:359 (-) Transcript_2448:477-1553(-)
MGRCAPWSASGAPPPAKPAPRRPRDRARQGSSALAGTSLWSLGLAFLYSLLKPWLAPADEPPEQTRRAACAAAPSAAASSASSARCCASAPLQGRSAFSLVASFGTRDPPPASTAVATSPRPTPAPLRALSSVWSRMGQRSLQRSSKRARETRSRRSIPSHKDSTSKSAWGAFERNRRTPSHASRSLAAGFLDSRGSMPVLRLNCEAANLASRSTNKPPESWREFTWDATETTPLSIRSTDTARLEPPRSTTTHTDGSTAGLVEAGGATKVSASFASATATGSLKTCKTSSPASLPALATASFCAGVAWAASASTQGPTFPPPTYCSASSLSLRRSRARSAPGQVASPSGSPLALSTG